MASVCTVIYCRFTGIFDVAAAAKLVHSGSDIYAPFFHRISNLHLQPMTLHIFSLLHLNFSYDYIRKGKHASTAKEHLDKIVGFFSKIDPILGDIVLKSKPPNEVSTSNDATSIHAAKRKSSEVDESQGMSPKKKANVESSNGTMTLSQREKRGIESLATYLEERGGKPVQLIVNSHLIMSFQLQHSSHSYYLHR